MLLLTLFIDHLSDQRRTTSTTAAKNVVHCRVINT
jgi:hypothetical protein